MLTADAPIVWGGIFMGGLYRASFISDIAISHLQPVLPTILLITCSEKWCFSSFLCKFVIVWLGKQIDAKSFISKGNKSKKELSR